MNERRLDGGFDPMSRREVVHSQPLVTLGPQRRGTVRLLEEVRCRRAHVGAGEEDLAVRLERALVRCEQCAAVASGEAKPRLGARVGHSASGELPRHRAREAGDFLDVDVRQHPRPARRDRKEVVVDDDEGLEAGSVVAELDDAHGAEATPSSPADLLLRGEGVVRSRTRHEGGSDGCRLRPGVRDC